jgi:hypothetical protein
MKKATVVSLAILALAMAVGGLYYLSRQEYVFRFSESQIQERLSTQLPLTKTYLLVFRVSLDNPRVKLEDGSGRVAAGLDAVLELPLGGEKSAIRGALDISAGIRYAPDQGAFYLTEPTIERADVQGIPPRYAKPVNALLSKVLGEYCAGHPIYTLKASDVKQRAAKLVLKNVTVENRELVVTLGL